MQMWKYRLEPGGITTVEMPEPGSVLSVVEQRGIALYALVDPAGERELRRFAAPLTGQEIPGEVTSFVGTVRAPGDWVAHVFEIEVTAGEQPDDEIEVSKPVAREPVAS